MMLLFNYFLNQFKAVNLFVNELNLGASLEFQTECYSVNDRLKTNQPNENHTF